MKKLFTLKNKAVQEWILDGCFEYTDVTEEPVPGRTNREALAVLKARMLQQLKKKKDLRKIKLAKIKPICSEEMCEEWTIVNAPGEFCDFCVEVEKSIREEDANNDKQ